MVVNLMVVSRANFPEKEAWAMQRPTAHRLLTPVILCRELPEKECFRTSPSIAEIRGKKLARDVKEERVVTREWRLIYGYDALKARLTVN